MLPANTFVVLELARQQQEALARRVRRGHLSEATTHHGYRRRRRRAAEQ